MPRGIGFSREEVLDAAMHVFWTQGYQATSMLDLEAATGLKPGSLYNSFVSKKGLFLEVIDHYRSSMVGMRIATVLHQGQPLDGIEAFFRTTYDAFEPHQLVGCLLTNIATEIGNDDAIIQDRIAGGLQMIEEAFRHRIEEAQNRGDFPKDRNAADVALHLTSCYQGLCVVGRLSRDKNRLKVIADQALASLSLQ